MFRGQTSTAKLGQPLRGEEMEPDTRFGGSYAERKNFRDEFCGGLSALCGEGGEEGAD